MTLLSYGQRLAQRVIADTPVCFAGVYDVFSATLAGRYFDGIFVSGYGFAASFYGMPDIGLIAWADMAAFVQRLRTALPSHHLMTDIDDGYGDPDVAAHAAQAMQRAGTSGIVLEDQKRPRRCGHVDGKQVMDLDDFLIKLRCVRSTVADLYLVARTDALGPAEQIRRVIAFEEAGADAVLIDGVTNFAVLREAARQLTVPLMFNQIAGGKSPACSLSELNDIGVRLVNYSTPCLFAAHAAIDAQMRRLTENDGVLPTNGLTVPRCNAILHDNLIRRDLPSLPMTTPVAPLSSIAVRGRK